MAEPRAQQRSARCNIFDGDPISFPAPLSAVPEVTPSELPASGEIIIDPYGGLYCFVCRVNVPCGAQNIEQHLQGRKHELNNSRFASVAEKLEARDRYLKAVIEFRTKKQTTTETPNMTPQRISGYVTSPTNQLRASPTTLNDPPQPPSLTPKHQSSPMSSTPLPVLRNESAAGAVSLSIGRSIPQEGDIVNLVEADQNSTVSAVPTGSVESTAQSIRSKLRFEEALKMRREKEERAKRLNATITIDKKSFIESVLDHLDEPGKDTEDSSDDSEPQSTLHQYKARRASMGSLNYKAPDGPDYFFESMAPETPRSSSSLHLRESIKSASNVTPKKVASSKTETAVTEFIPLSSTEKETKREQNRQYLEKSVDECIVLRDTNSEALPPWLLDQIYTENILYTADSSVALHFEILEFVRFVSPTQLEIQARKEMFMTIETIAKRLWADCTVESFGSYATGLALPSSDVDICIMNTPEGGSKDEFEALAEAVRNISEFAKRVQVVNAKVPIVKVISRRTNMNCDVSIGVNDGVKNVPRIKKLVEQYPALRPLLLVVKCFLQQQQLNEVYSGGLGSYTSLLLVVSHLQMLRYNFPRSKANLGAYLHAFFNLYGKLMSFIITGVQVRDGGRYYEKFQQYPFNWNEIIRFSVEDPNNVTNELGRNGYNAHRVRGAFSNASRSLAEWRRYDGRKSPTPLGAIINPSLDFLLRRRAVLEDMERQGQHPLRENLPSSGLSDSQSVHSRFNDTRRGDPLLQSSHLETPRSRPVRDSFVSDTDGDSAWEAEIRARRTELKHDGSGQRRSRSPAVRRDRPDRYEKRRRTKPGSEGSLRGNQLDLLPKEQSSNSVIADDRIGGNEESYISPGVEQEGFSAGKTNIDGQYSQQPSISAVTPGYTYPTNPPLPEFIPIPLSVSTRPYRGAGSRRVDGHTNDNSYERSAARLGRRNRRKSSRSNRHDR